MGFRLDSDDELYRQELRRFATCVPDPRYQARYSRKCRQPQTGMIFRPVADVPGC
jgi:hypothetical protein